MKYEDVEIGGTYYIADMFSDIFPVKVYDKKIDNIGLNTIKVVDERDKVHKMSAKFLYATKKEALNDKLKDLIRDIENKEEELDNLKEEKEAVLTELENCNE